MPQPKTARTTRATGGPYLAANSIIDSKKAWWTCNMACLRSVDGSVGPAGTPGKRNGALQGVRRFSAGGGRAGQFGFFWNCALPQVDGSRTGSLVDGGVAMGLLTRRALALLAGGFGLTAVRPPTPASNLDSATLNYDDGVEALTAVRFASPTVPRRPAFAQTWATGVR